MLLHCFQTDTLLALNKVIGSYSILGKKRTIGSALVVSSTSELDRLKVFKPPLDFKVPTDIFLQNFLRSYSDSIIHKVRFFLLALHLQFI